MPTRSTDLPERLATPTNSVGGRTAAIAAGQTVGMVPTMGALHAGHRALIDRAVGGERPRRGHHLRQPRAVRPQRGLLALPAQPRCRTSPRSAAAGAHAAFVPSVEAMYPAGLMTRIHVEGHLGDRLEGASRPGPPRRRGPGRHQAARRRPCPIGPISARRTPSRCAVVRHLARDLDTGVEIVVCPTVRDTDGLADLEPQCLSRTGGPGGSAGDSRPSLAAALAEFDAGRTGCRAC